MNQGVDTENALFVQDDFTNLIQSYSTQTKNIGDTVRVYLYRFLPLHRSLDRIYTDNSREFMNTACRDLQWNHDTSELDRSETNGVADRAVRRVREGTTIALEHSGVPEEGWYCAMECSCYLRNVHDKMADGKTAFEKKYGQKFDGPIHCFRNVGWAHPDYREGHHRFGHTTVKNILGLLATCGRRKICKNQKPQKSTSKD